MDLMDLLKTVGGESSLGQIAGAVGIDESQAKSLVGALAPALMRGIEKQTDSADGISALKGALDRGNHQRYINEPGLMRSSETADDGNKILGHLFGNKDVSRNVAAQAASDTGLDAGIIKKALPLVAGLAMGAISKQSSESEFGSGALGGLVGSLLGSADSGRGGGSLLGLPKWLF